MTRRKAIEAAMEEGWRHTLASGIFAPLGPQDANILSWAASARAYDLGRIAGLREAARITKTSSDWWHPMIGEVRDKADKMARRLKP